MQNIRTPANKTTMPTFPQRSRCCAAKAIFRQEMPTSIFQYLQDFRMANARRLLRQPYGNIKKIAYACGYPDNGCFARQFKKLHHCTPQEYRSRKFADPEFKAEHKLDFIRQCPG